MKDPTERLGFLFVMLVLVALVVCGCATPTSADNMPDYVFTEWQIGQQRLISHGFPADRVRTVLPEQFVWEFENGPLKCKHPNGCNGLFVHPRTIKINTETPTVVRHEAQHAILYKLRYPSKIVSCVEHHVGKHAEEECIGWPWGWVE